VSHRSSERHTRIPTLGRALAATQQGMQFLSRLGRKRAVWLICVLVCFSVSPFLPPPVSWIPLLSGVGHWFWLIFFPLQWAFALVMLPSLPLVLLAAVLFPNAPGLVFLMAIIGVAGSAAVIYRFASALGLGEALESSPRSALASRWIRSNGALALAVWSATPFLPTDVGCYVAASARMRFGRYMAAVLLGESVLCAGVIFSAHSVVARMSA